MDKDNREGEYSKKKKKTVVYEFRKERQEIEVHK